MHRHTKNTNNHQQNKTNPKSNRHVEQTKQPVTTFNQTETTRINNNEEVFESKGKAWKTKL